MQYFLMLPSIVADSVDAVSDPDENNIVGNCVVEEQHFLCDQRHLLTQAVQMHRINGVAINANLATSDVQKIGQQVGKGALATTRWTNECNALSRSNNEVNVGKSITLGFGIAVADFVKNDVATHFII